MNSESELTTSVPEEIPSKSIDAVNEEKQQPNITENDKNITFSPIKFGGNDEIVDEEITISRMARNNKEERLEKEKVIEVTKIAFEATGPADSYEFAEPGESRLQRKSDEDICNTPKRERHFEDQNLNIRRSREPEISETDALNIVVKTPQKSKNELVKSLSMEFEQRLASIHVSPKIQSTTSAPRSMSPVRCVAAQLSPVSKLNLNEDEEDVQRIVVEAPKLVSPSKIVAAASSIEIEKVRQDLESKVIKVKMIDIIILTHIYYLSLYLYFYLSLLISGQNRSNSCNLKLQV